MDSGILFEYLEFYFSGGKWSHIKKYVETKETFPHNLHNTITSSTYSGRLLLESLDCDRSSTEHHSPSLASHASQLSSSSLLNIPSCTTTGPSSTGPDISSSCLPEDYLQIYSEYDPSFPPSSSMLVLPHAPNTQDVMDAVPKSLSTGALSGSAGYPEPCCAGPHDTGKSVAEGQVMKDHIICPYHNGDNVAEEDRVSIGSDTLSGVSEDFSCSLPVGVPELLPDTVPLPEVIITMNNSVNNSCDELAQSVESKEICDDNIDGCVNADSSSVIKTASAENGKEMPGSKQERSPLIENGGKDNTMSYKPTDHLDHEENSITDTSFASTTLPSFSWTKQEDSEVPSLDIEDLIRNSRQLLQNVDHTLLQSRSQSVVFPDSGENSSADHSELPYDGDSVSQDLLDKGGSLANQNSLEKKALSISLSKSNTPVRLSPLMARRLGKSKKSSLKSAKSEGNLSTPQKRPDVSAGKNIIVDPETRSVKQAELIPNIVTQVALPSLEQSQDFTKNNSSSQRESPSPIICDPPPESSLASLLEKYSANRGQDSQPRLPEGIVKVWLSQVISAVSFLHQQGIVWGDLNPDNILLDEGGSILMTYESRWSSVQQGVWRSQGLTSQAKKWMQKGYLAPELTSPLSHPTPASDWWSVGALMYHLLTGQSISQAHPSGITSHTELLIPPHLSPEAVSLLSQLLCVHPTERLGGGGAGVQEVKDHTFFTGIQWVN
ncbi:uncharacterized protein LOC126995341 [Eriocheir sinensis]|uniref:uncharacterized protein LOC126995341 n=1 Tax=Eriocheir sinensis TaxID=95602 RepID=UPI0021CA4179|nr:uncharacterized protein LOC126995341 [Eriocheir sinensis]